MNNLFFDCEFTSLRQDTTLISLGVVSEKGIQFYAEFDDYNKKYIDKWINDNVIKNLILKDMTHNSNRFENHLRIHYCKGDSEYIRNEFIHWLEFNFIGMEKDKFQFISDVCYYDFVLLINFLTKGKTALDLPKYISPVCHDINQDIANYYNKSDVEAFDLDREGIVEFEISKLFIKEDINKHNSLWDAKVIALIYNKLNYEKRQQKLIIKEI